MAVSAPGVVRSFFDQYQPRQYSKGQVFLLDGEKSDHIYFLTKGRVKVYSISYRGDEIILHVHKAPDFFPLHHVIGETENKYIYEADTETMVHRAPAGDVKKFLESHPPVILRLLRQSYKIINSFLERQSLLMSGTATSRLVYELIMQCRQFGSKGPSGHYTLDVREKELASRIGLSRETVNREMKKLKREQLVVINHSSIIIPDIATLEKKLGQSV